MMTPKAEAMSVKPLSEEPLAKTDFLPHNFIVILFSGPSSGRGLVRAVLL
jgi:hypothetical protein